MTDSDNDYTFSRCINSYYTSDSYIFYEKPADSITYDKKRNNDRFSPDSRHKSL